MKIEEFKKRLNNGYIDFEYVKKDGSVRNATGTTNAELIPSEHHPKGIMTGSPDVVRYFDKDKNGWRSLIFDETTVRIHEKDAA